AGPDDDAWRQALNKVREQAYQEALNQSELRVVSEPEFAWLSARPGADCVFTATVEVLPTVDISGLDKLVIERPDTEVSDDDVTRALELLRDEHKSFDSVERPARVGDRVVFDYVGTIDGNAFKGSAVEGAAAVVGAGDTLDDMDAALVGRAAGQAFTVPITFPGDYTEFDLRGKCAQFDIVVQTVAEPCLPDLGPDFVRRLGVTSGSLEELRGQLRDRLEHECTQARHRYERRQLSQALLDAVPVTVPETLLRQEMQRIRQTFEQETTSGEVPAEPMPEAPLEATAKRRLALTLILSELMHQCKIRLDERQVEKKLDELAVRYGDVESVKRRYRADEQLMHNVRALVMEETGFEAALKTARKTSVSMSFDELLRADQEGH
ncbi:MAG: trigger factor, partial [Thiotrichales bacterium]|nr:trigger factor [Thiotrichales bacterium]